MIRTRITDSFDLATPIVSAGRALVGRPPLAAAVSNAGGLGFLGGDLTPAWRVREMIRVTRTLTARPFGVGFVTPFATDEHLKACVVERPAVVAFASEAPTRRWVDALHDVGIGVWFEVRSPAEARKAAKQGFDALIVQGGQPRDYLASANLVTLLPAINEAIGPLPVIAGGGIVDGRGLASALALGADAVWCETRFLASAEAHVSPCPAPAGFEDGRSASTFARQWLDRHNGVLKRGVVHARKGRTLKPTPCRIADTSWFGHDVTSPLDLWVGLPQIDVVGLLAERRVCPAQSAETIWEIKSAAAIVREMSDEADEAFASLLSIVLG